MAIWKVIDLEAQKGFQRTKDMRKGPVVPTEGCLG